MKLPFILLSYHLIIYLFFILYSLNLTHSQSLSYQPHNIIFNQNYNKCMIQNCIQCQNNMPYTCKTCTQNKLCCSPYCLKCSSTDFITCQECQPNYTYNSTSKTCKLINQCNQQLCDHCANDLCDKCTVQTVLNPYTNTCIRCPIGCETCNQTLDCSICIFHYFYKNLTCIICDQNCYLCEKQANYCTSCNIARYLISQNHTCGQCINKCIQCRNGDSCINCQMGYFYNNKTNKCQLCGQYCFKCKSLIQCQLCQEGYYLDQKTKFCMTCQQCIPNCSNCTNQQQINSIPIPSNTLSNNLQRRKNVYVSSVRCLQCNSGYFLRNFNVCSKCQLHCLVCKDSVSCQTCQPGYTKNSVTKMCDTCQINNCLSCKNQKQCAYCAVGYFWNNIKFPKHPFCDQCPVGCTQCGINYCSRCDKGYYYINNACLKCNLQCVSCLNKPDYCLNCMPGYYIADSLYKCMKCQIGCSRCLNKNQCDECSVGYRNQKYSCLKCTINNCGYCVLNNISQFTAMLNSDQPQICLQCLQGFYYQPSNFTCLKCMQGCLLCQSATSCLACTQTYYIQEYTKLCKKCQENCKICNVDQTMNEYCQVCIDNYFLNVSTMHCDKCTAQNCFRCNMNICFKCSSGYYISIQTEKCLKCQENCSQCIDDKSCVICKDGFYWKNYSCIPCQDGCQLCNEDGTCAVCAIGYRVDNTTHCQTCKTKNCAQCSTNSQQCNICNIGFTLQIIASQQFMEDTNKTNSSICFKCGQNSLLGCSKCQSSIECSQCINGYEINENNMCSVENHRVWPLILTICVLGVILLVILGIKMKKKMKGKSIKQILKLGNKSDIDPQDYHKLQDLSLK